MLNREDIRKVLDAYNKVKVDFRDSGKDLEDISMRDMQEAVLGKIQEQERIQKQIDANKDKKGKYEI